MAPLMTSAGVALIWPALARSTLTGYRVPSPH